MATIKQGGWSYTLTPTDKLWAARMIEGEGPASDSAAVLWTMTQLFAPAGQQVKYGNPHRYRSFTDLIRAYSQPINPIWYAGGARCPTANTTNCSSSRLSRRASIAQMPISALPADKRAVLERWWSGSLANPVPGAIEFAAPNVSRSFLGRNPGWSKIGDGANWYLRPPTVLPRTSIGGGASAILLVGGGLALAWFGGRWLRRRRR